MTTMLMLSMMLLYNCRMRAAHGVLLHLFAVFLAPYFVHFCDSWTALGYRRDRCGRTTDL